MNNKKIILILAITASVLLTFLSGCDDSGIAPGPPAEPPKPTITFKPGAVYYFTNDTISASGTQGSTTWLTKSTVGQQTTHSGKICYPIQSITTDTFFQFPPILRNEIEYFYYDASTYIFYQFGAKQLFDSNQAGTWDPVADFSVALGTKVSLFTITILGVTFQVSSTVESQTTIQTTSQPPATVDCFKVTVVAEAVGVPNTSASMEYYIGYTPSSNPNNPAGRVRFKVPSSVQNIPPFPGGEQKLNRYTMP